MKLKFKPQSTFYTCEQATQGIAINSFLDINYTDLDIITKNMYGYPLRFSILMLAQDLVRQDFQPSLPYNQTHHQLARGLFRVLTTQQRLPSYEEAIQAYIELSILSQQSYEKRLREEPFAQVIRPGGSEKIRLAPEEVEERIRKFAEAEDKERKSVEDLLNEPLNRLFFQRLRRHLDEELFKPIKYRFYNGEDSSLGIVDVEFSAVTILSYGSLGVESIDKDALVESTKRGDIVIFGAHRASFGLKDYSTQAGHSWIVDRIENNRVVLLDTNHLRYGRSQEVDVTLELLLNIELNRLVRVYKK